jgi:hypothetical protein
MPRTQNFGQARLQATQAGASTLLEYSAAKAAVVAQLLAEAQANCGG